jgi:hypothetical protein
MGICYLVLSGRETFFFFRFLLSLIWMFNFLNSNIFSAGIFWLVWIPLLPVRRVCCIFRLFRFKGSTCGFQSLCHMKRSSVPHDLLVCVQSQPEYCNYNAQPTIFSREDSAVFTFFMWAVLHIILKHWFASYYKPIVNTGLNVPGTHSLRIGQYFNDFNM